MGSREGGNEGRTVRLEEKKIEKRCEGAIVIIIKVIIIFSIFYTLWRGAGARAAFYGRTVALYRVSAVAKSVTRTPEVILTL